MTLSAAHQGTVWDSADQRHPQIEQQRKHLRDEIDELPRARDRFWQQTIELEEERSDEPWRKSKLRASV